MAHYDYSHGMEIEQDPEQAPSSVVYGDDWERDASGPQETEYGPYKQVKSILNAFKRDCAGETWDWHNETISGNGCGSHVHLNVGSGFDDEVEAWTVTWNTAVEMIPFMLPMFCADWSEGYRYSIGRWAGANTTRYSQDSIQNYVENPHIRSRDYDAVTLNSAEYSGKPLTIELRMNEAHPAQAIVGLLFFRRLAGRCVKKGWSPKLAGNRSQLLAEIYDEVYNADDPFEALASVGPVRFEEGRGIPGVGEVFDSALDVLTALLKSMGTDPGNYKDRMKKFTLGRIEFTDTNGALGHNKGPEDLGDELWRIDEPTDFWHTIDEY